MIKPSFSCLQIPQDNTLKNCYWLIFFLCTGMDESNDIFFGLS